MVPCQQESANQELQEQVGESGETIRQQQEQLVALQLLIEQLQAQLKEREMEDVESLDGDFDQLGESRGTAPPTTTRRAKSVPAHMVGNRSARSDVSSSVSV